MNKRRLDSTEQVVMHRLKEKSERQEVCSSIIDWLNLSGWMASSFELLPMTRQKQDLAWKHCQLFEAGQKVHMKCTYCGKVFKGGGIYRFKEHLAGRKGGGPMCQLVPTDVQVLMQQLLDGITRKQKPKQKLIKEETCFLLGGAGGGGGEREMHLLPDELPASSELISPSRQKRDLAWGYCQMFKSEHRVHIKCKYCSKMFKGGGIHRFKEHLAGRKGDAPICVHVPPDVQLLMQQSLYESIRKQKKRKSSLEPSDVSPPIDYMDPYADPYNESNPDSNALQATASSEGADPGLLPAQVGISKGGGGGGGGCVDSSRRKRGRPRNSSIVVDEAHPLNSLSLKVMDDPIHMALGRFLYDIGADLGAMDSIYFQPLIDAIASGMMLVSAPSHDDLRGRILKNLVEEVKNGINGYKMTWVRTGCSILVEECKLEAGTALNFLVHCPQGTVFLKSVSSSQEAAYSIDGLYELLKQVVEEVGAEHVLQVITNGEEDYAPACERLVDTFPSLYWAPCAAHCIDMILEDFGNLDWIRSVIEQARSITRFMYNNSVVLHLMRVFTSGSNIVRQGITRSATDFTMLKRMADFKLNLEAMFASQEWAECSYAKQPEGLAVLGVINSPLFWSSCISIVHLTAPLLLGLRLVSSEQKPAMGYVFSAMYQAKATIKKELVDREEYLVYWDIIDHRWGRQHPPLHAAGFFLNPKFFYGIDGDVHNSIMSRMLDCIERMVPDTEVQDKIVKEIDLYKSAVGDLGRKIAIRAIDSLLPAEWWSTYGGGCPNLMRLAVRILSQTCSSASCKRNPTTLSKLHTTKNCLERQRLRDMVFVQSNLHLRQFDDKNRNQTSVDSVSFENGSFLEEWTVPNDHHVEESQNSNWVSLVSTSDSTFLSESAIDEDEETLAVFDDDEIFDGIH